jgi:eukaryotic-like serine/threonine-protein kinase
MIGKTLTHYKVTARLGVGGMGEVYRATDTKLDRQVAIKVLPPEFAQHPERLARFEREAKALAKLNHPNIGTIHGFDQHEGQWFIVLELVEGRTLAEHLRPGPMPVENALKIFKQIAEALEAAHEKDIVHRDLKPANIKIDPQGRVKVLDFGLAKARFTQPSGADSQASTADSMAPTITSEFTQPGKVMGTAAYMSPEQSRGQEVDRRTDVWAFGCCLYEALTGKKPFKGQTVSDLMADILKSDPDFTVIPPETPGEVLTLLRRCLEKDPQRRMRYLGDIALTLEDVTETSRLNTVVREAPRSPKLAEASIRP